MRRKLIAYLLMAAVLLAGCVSNPHPHGGRFIAELKPDDCASTCWTPYQATYVLYHWRDRPCDPPPQTWIPEAECYELYVRGLARWQKIGFEKNSKGELFAVAGDEKILLEKGRYCWHISPDTQYRGVHRILNETGENIVYIASLPFGLAGAAIALPVIVGIGAVGLVCIPFWMLMG